MPAAATDEPLPAPLPASAAPPRRLAAALARWLRPRPLPLTGDPRRVPPDSPPGPVDVVVPIHGAADELGRCLRSLLAHTDLERHRLLLVLDGPQSAAVTATVAAVMGEPAGGATAGRFQVIELRERGGFVAAVNRGMGESNRDVVLLNSDTRVTAGWLDKLQRAAYSAPEIATVTPFSNSATICSLPRFLAANALPAGWDLDRFARLVEERALPAWPRLPTGVGVCLYVKRKALAQLGLFDRRSFGLGYGEESEFCMRALKAGYAHVLDDATFIFHEGQRSFGSSHAARVAVAHRQLARLHPEYLATVARFLRDDPLQPIRERVVAALRPPRRPSANAGRTGSPARVLHVVHGWPPWNHAGTELYAAWLVRRQAAHREVTVFGRIADPARARLGIGDALELVDGGARVRLLVRNFDERDPRSRNALASRPVERDFARLLAEVRPQLVHVHHLAGHAASVPAMVRRRGIPLLYQIQDWWTPCARANLCDSARRLCSGPAPGKCAACLPLTGLPPAPAWNRLLYRYRAAATRRALRGAAAYVMGSRFIHDSYLRLGLLRPGDPVHVLSYGIELVPPARRPNGPTRPPGGPLRFGVIGSMLPHKGIHVAAAAFRGIDPRSARLSVWGDPAIDPDYARELAALGARPGGQAGDAGGGVAVTLAGPFAEACKAAVFAELDVLIVPSLGLESFGLVAREALHHGVPVLASRRGALPELFPDAPPEAVEAVGALGAAAPDPGAGPGAHAPPPPGEGAGALFEPGDPADLRRWIDRLIADPELLASWRRRLPPVKGADEHAEEIEEVYRAILAGTSSGAAR
jgi:GT2 family glycosyltransferase/glycosyltransferase involved in cell wall biosynthesis